MGLKIEKTEQSEEINEFFDEYSVDEFEAFFPVEMAHYAKRSFKKKEHSYAAYLNGELVGAILFTVQGGVGQLTAIQVDNRLDPVRQLRIRKALIRQFIETCKDNTCHLCFMWLPHQYAESLKCYLQQGFERIFTARNFWYRKDYILLANELV